jgi:nicotinamide-nucleotide amidase
MENTAQAAQIGQALLRRKQRLALAESCTGGLIAKLVTDVAGSSAWFERGLVTYSNRAKQELLAVPESLLSEHGAVSEPCARAMVTGLLRNSPADWGIAVTGIAGPGGGTTDKPVGTVWIAWLQRGAEMVCERYCFDGDREQIRVQTAQVALQRLCKNLG